MCCSTLFESRVESGIENKIAALQDYNLRYVVIIVAKLFSCAFRLLFQPRSLLRIDHLHKIAVSILNGEVN